MSTHTNMVQVGTVAYVINHDKMEVGAVWLTQSGDRTYRLGAEWLDPGSTTTIMDSEEFITLKDAGRAFIAMLNDIERKWN